MKYSVVVLICFCLLTAVAGGQESERAIDNLSLSVRSIAFIRNNEYFNPIGPSKFILSTGLPWPADKSEWIEGYTLTGYFLQPELVYSPTSKISISAGIHLLRYSGESGFYQARPVLSTSLKISENTTIRLGSLKGSDSHMMFDPHFNFERLYNNYAEDGFQLSTKTENVFNDTWLAWENYIFKKDNEREIFTFGESFIYNSQFGEDNVEVEIPVQMQFKHFGGQISDYPEPVSTFFNFAGGIRFNYDFDFVEAGIEYIHFINSVFPSKSRYPLQNGNASWLRLHVSKGIFSFCSSYWYANDFFAPNGNGIYASVFDFTSDYIIHKRELLTASIFLDYPAADYMKLLFGLDTYYDINNEMIDYALTLHLDFSKLFSLGRADRQLR